MSDFSALKKNRGKFQDLSQKLKDDKKGGGGFKEQEGFWKLPVDDAGNGYAVIRFLPAPKGEEYPYIKRFSHSFKDKKTNKWYIENSRTTIGEVDPVGEANSALWNTGLESDKEIARSRSRRQEYISNIFVIQDSKHPENEGKAFKFSYGPRIFQKIEGALSPEFEDETPFNPFDLWEGANFKLKARMLDNQRSYDKSGFDAPTALFDGDDAALEKLYASLPSLQEEISADKFKSYEELKKKFDQVTGAYGIPRPSEDDSPKPKAAENKPRREEPKGSDDSEEDETMAKYKALLED